MDYGPNSGFSGSDSFSYMVSNGVESASAAVNVIVGGSGSEGVSGDVTKGPICRRQHPAVSHRRSRAWPPAARWRKPPATPRASGRWRCRCRVNRCWWSPTAASTPTRPTPIRIPSLRRVIQLQAGDALEAVMPAADDYLSLNLYTNAMLEKSRKETVGNEFDQVYAANRSLMTQAMGFDPITTAPTDPGNPNPAASAAAKQYALLLGGASNVLNAVAQRSGQNAVAFNVLDALHPGLQRLRSGRHARSARRCSSCSWAHSATCPRISISTWRSCVSVTTTSIATPASRPASTNATCGQSGAVPDTVAPVISLAGANPLTFEGWQCVRGPRRHGQWMTAMVT